MPIPGLFVLNKDVYATQRMKPKNVYFSNIRTTYKRMNDITL